MSTGTHRPKSARTSVKTASIASPDTRRPHSTQIKLTRVRDIYASTQIANKPVHGIQRTNSNVTKTGQEPEQTGRLQMFGGRE